MTCKTSVDAVKIKYIFDCDGFSYSGRFELKEIAIGNLDTSEIELYHAKLTKNFNQLTGKQKRGVCYCTYNLHGMDYSNERGDLPLGAIYDLLENYCIDADSNGRLIGYKGGHYELDILKKLNYAHLAVNIETFGCPRFDILCSTLDNTSRFFTRYAQCGKHRKLRKSQAVVHCSRVEIAYFIQFMYNTYK